MAVPVGKASISLRSIGTAAQRLDFTPCPCFSPRPYSCKLPPKPAYRLSVWNKGAGGWQWISHANLAPIP